MLSYLLSMSTSATPLLSKLKKQGCNDTLHDNERVNKPDHSPSVHPSHVNKDTPIIDKHIRLGEYSKAYCQLYH